MKRFVLFIIMIAALCCPTVNAQNITPESVIAKWEKEKDADLTNISSFMMKMMSAMVGGEGKAFLKKTKKLSLLDLNDCSADCKARCKQYFEKLEMKGYVREKQQDKSDGENMIVFVKIEKDKITNVLSAILGPKEYIITFMKGDYDMETMKGLAETNSNLID